MPIYEYRCAACGTEFEELRRSSDDAGVTCPRCQGRRVTRQLSAFAVHAAAPAAAAPDAGPCGACGAAQRGLCSGDFD